MKPDYLSGCPLMTQVRKAEQARTVGFCVSFEDASSKTHLYINFPVNKSTIVE